MFDFIRALRRSFTALTSALVMFTGIAASDTAQADDGCNDKAIVTMDHGGALGHAGLGYTTAVCNADGKILYGQDFDIKTHDVSKLLISDTLQKYLVQTKGNLAEAQKLTDIDKLRQDIRDHNPAVATLDPNLPVYDLATGELIVANLQSVTKPQTHKHATLAKVAVHFKHGKTLVTVRHHYHRHNGAPRHETHRVVTGKPPLKPVSAMRTLVIHRPTAHFVPTHRAAPAFTDFVKGPAFT